MNNLIPTAEFTAVYPETLDRLWHEAEQLGTVEVDCDWTKRFYVVTINWVRKSGTRIMAKGSDSSVIFALSKAINEARELGGGTVA